MNTSKRGFWILMAILAGILWASSLRSGFPPAPGEAALIDIQNIEALRKQFNRDEGTIRLIVLVAPT